MRYVQILYPANSTASVARGSQSHFEMTAVFSVLGLEEDKGIKVHLCLLLSVRRGNHTYREWLATASKLLWMTR